MPDIEEIDRQYARLTAIEQAVKVLEFTGRTNMTCLTPADEVMRIAKQIEKYILGESS